MEQIGQEVEEVVRDSLVLYEEQISKEQSPVELWEMPFNSHLAKIERQKLAWTISQEFFHKGSLGYFLKLALKPNQFQEWIDGKLKFSTSQVYQFQYGGQHLKGHFAKV